MSASPFFASTPESVRLYTLTSGYWGYAVDAALAHNEGKDDIVRLRLAGNMTMIVNTATENVEILPELHLHARGVTACTIQAIKVDQWLSNNHILTHGWVYEERQEAVA